MPLHKLSNQEVKALKALEGEISYRDGHSAGYERFTSRRQLGAGIGETTMARLLAAGYAIEGLDPCPAAKAIASRMQEKRICNASER